MMKNRFINLFALVIACLSSMFPYLLILLSAFNSSVDIKRGNILTNISFEVFIDNAKKVLKDEVFFSSLRNSIIISSLSVIIGILVASLAGYAYIIYRNKHSDKLFLSTFFCVFIPTTITIIPLFMIVGTLTFINDLLLISLISISLPFLVYLFRQNSKSFPLQLIKMARIDGLTEFQIFFKVYLPNMKSLVVTTAIILFIDSWNSFMSHLILIQSQSDLTLALYLNNLGSSTSSDYGVFMMAIIFSTIPILLLFCVLQKNFNIGIKPL